MNIKDHIEAGHYPVDDKGRALVYIGDLGEEDWTCGLATVLATDGPVGEEIIARFPDARASHWAAGGRRSFPTRAAAERSYVLLPPLPRKVTERGWARIGTNGEIRKFSKDYAEAMNVGVTEETVDHFSSDRMVEATIEYEEPWS